MSSPSEISRPARGAGLALLLLGLFGALVPFVGPSFGYGMGGVAAWTWTESHATLHLAPGIAAMVGGLFVMRGRSASTQRSGAILAAVGGTWFVVAPSLHPLWAASSSSSGMGGMGGSPLSGALSALGYHYGTGVLIAVIAAYAVGSLSRSRRLTVDGRDESPQADRRTTSESGLVDARA